MKIKLMAIALLLVVAVMPLAIAQPVPLAERHRIAIEKYNEAKANYLQKKGMYEDAREDFMKMRLRWRQFRAANESPELIAKAKDFLTKAVDRGITHIELIERWVEKINISDEEKSELTAMLEENKAKLEGLKDDIEAATTKQEIEDIAKQIREVWLNIRVDVKKVVGIGMNARIKHILNRMELLSEKLNERIEKLKESGVDTSSLESLLSKFNSHLDEANANYEKAKEKFKEAATPKEIDDLMRAGNQYIKEAHKHLRLAHAVLVEIVKELRQSKIQTAQTATEPNATEVSENETAATEVEE